jgi:hypothetical protein
MKVWSKEYDEGKKKEIKEGIKKERTPAVVQNKDCFFFQVRVYDSYNIKNLKVLNLHFVYTLALTCSGYGHLQSTCLLTYKHILESLPCLETLLQVIF